MNVVTWSPTDKSANTVLANNNLNATMNGRDSYTRSSERRYTGKYYYELKIDAYSQYSRIGVSRTVSHSAVESSFYYVDGRIVTGSGGATINKSPYTKDDVIGIMLNLDDNNVTYFKNNTLQSTVTIQVDSNVGVLPLVESGYTGFSVTANFGATPFKYELPNGYLPYDTSGTWWRPPVLLECNEELYSIKTGSWINIGQFPSDPLQQKQLFEEYGMDEVTGEQIEQLKAMLPNKKIKILSAKIY